MSKNTIYGNANKVYLFGNNSNDLQLSLLFSGNCDSGHYDIINYNNNNIES